MSQKLAFVGLGIMGLPMAGHLLSAGHSLSVHSRTKSKAQPLLARGATWAETPAGAASDADIILICVPDTPDVERVLFGDDGIAASAKPSSIVVDHSTISPSATRKFARLLADKRISMLDAPVSGGDVGARNATLTILVGGELPAFQSVTPLLSVMGKTITHCGGSGTGQLTKLTNQVLVVGALQAVAEAVSFAEKAGLDVPRTLAALNAGAAGSWQLANLGPRMAVRDYAPGFMIDLARKDLRLVLEEADALAASVPAVRLVKQELDAVAERGLGSNGTQAILEAILNAHLSSYR